MRVDLRIVYGIRLDDITEREVAEAALWWQAVRLPQLCREGVITAAGVRVP